MTHRLASICAKNYCNRTPVVKVIVENVVTCFFGDMVYNMLWQYVLCQGKPLFETPTTHIIHDSV